MKYKCPCCGYITMEHQDPLYHDICPVCFWENDPIQNETPDYSGGANKLSLNQSRDNYLNIGATSENILQHVRKPLASENN